MLHGWFTQVRACSVVRAALRADLYIRAREPGMRQATASSCPRSCRPSCPLHPRPETLTYAPPPPLQPSPFFSGALSEEAATPALNAALAPLYEELATLPPCVGCVTARLVLGGGGGRPRDLEWLACTLVGRPGAEGGGDDAAVGALAAIAEHLLRADFRAAPDGGETHVTLPFLFE